MAFNLSIVNIIADKHKDTINAIAAYYGTGDDALSVKLIDKDSNIFWGCHSWWQQQDYDYFTKAPPPETIPNAAEALAALYERVVDGGVPFENWTAALDELGLSVWADPDLI